LLIGDLPSSSRLWRAVDPDVAYAESWSTNEYLLALVADLIGKAHFQNWETIPRPAQEIAQKRRTDERRRKLIERFEARQRQATAGG